MIVPGPPPDPRDLVLHVDRKDAHRLVLPRDPRPAVVRPFRRKLLRIAACESGGRWFINTGNGFYGGLQFILETWWGVGGQGYPHLNSKLEQMYRAVKVFKRRGSWADWPICGY